MSPADLYAGLVFFVGGALFAQFNAFDRFLMLVGAVVSIYVGYEALSGQSWGSALYHAVLALVCIQLGYVAGLMLVHFRSGSGAPSRKGASPVSDNPLDAPRDVVRFQDQSASSITPPVAPGSRAHDA